MIALFVAVERRAAHPLLPLRILADRNRAVSLFAMLFVGAGMFAMFFFLGLYIQQVLGYSPVRSGFAFLPFSAGIVVSAGIASALVSRVDPRWLAGLGGVLASTGLWGFTHLTTTSSYAGGLLPWIVVMSLGMGFLFIPLTLTATARIDAADSGAAASALNTVQQIGGAVGIAGLTTAFTHFATQRGTELGTALQAQAAQSGVTPTAEQVAAAQHQVAMAAQTYGSTQSFWFAAGMLLLGGLAAAGILNVKHEELATDGQQAVHVG